MKKPVYKRWWFILLVVLIVIGGISAAMNDNDKGNDGGTGTENQAGGDENGGENGKEDDSLIDGFEVQGEFSEKKDEFGYYITGKVKNMTGEDLDYAQITFTLFDKDGAQIGTAIDNINSLKKDGVWKFKALGLENVDEIASYELDSITSF